MNRIIRTCAYCLLASSSLGAQTIWYVDASAPQGGNGTSWGNAHSMVGTALASANFGDSVWVKEGTYRPRAPAGASDPRRATFFVPQGVNLLGGFDGTELVLSQRAGRFEQTILSGDIGQIGDPSDNAYSVVKLKHPSGKPPGFTHVDGFQIRDGNGVVNLPDNGGGGIDSFNSALILSNCILRNNAAKSGGGLWASTGLVRTRWCTFENNYASKNGGALAGQLVNLRISHTIFRNNSAQLNGGAIHQSSTLGGLGNNAVAIGHCLFTDNSARAGGAIFVGGGPLSSGKANLSNCTLAYNRAQFRGGAIRAVTGFASPALVKLRNCVIWGNEAPRDPNLSGRQWVRYSCLEDRSWGGFGNLHEAPRFVDIDSRDLRLRGGSPANDAGFANMLPFDWSDVDMDGDVLETIEIDLLGQPRVVDDPSVGVPGQAQVDMGAYEFQPLP